MKKYFSICLLLFFSLASFAQEDTLSVGAGRLFRHNKSRLTVKEKNWLFSELKLTPAEDKRLFKSGEHDVAAQAYVTDMNKDGIEEVFLVTQNNELYGELGQAFTLYIKNNKGVFEKQSDIGYGMIMIITSGLKPGYPDICLGGPGNEYPVCSWDGKKYKPSIRKIQNADLLSKKVTYIDVAESNMQYLETFK